MAAKKQPGWACQVCGITENWATRIVCRNCKTGVAPTSVVDRIRARQHAEGTGGAGEVEQQRRGYGGGGGKGKGSATWLGGRGPRGAWAQGPPVIPRAKSKGKGKGKSKGGNEGKDSPPPNNSPEHSRCQQLKKLLEDTKANYKEDHPVVQQIQTDLNEAMAQVDKAEAQAVPKDPQGIGSMLRVKRQLQRATAALEKRQRELVAAEQQFKAARAALDEASSKVATAEWKLEQAREEAVALTAAAKSTSTVADFKAKSAQFEELLQRLEAAPDLATALATVKADHAKLVEEERKARQVKAEQCQVQSADEESPADEADDVSFSEGEHTEDEVREGDTEGFQTVARRGRKRLTKGTALGTAGSSSGGVHKKTKGSTRG